MVDKAQITIALGNRFRLDGRRQFPIIQRISLCLDFLSQSEIYHTRIHYCEQLRSLVCLFWLHIDVVLIGKNWISGYIDSVLENFQFVTGECIVP